MLNQAWLPCMGVNLGDADSVSDRLIRLLAINTTSIFLLKTICSCIYYLIPALLGIKVIWPTVTWHSNWGYLPRRSFDSFTTFCYVNSHRINKGESIVHNLQMAETISMVDASATVSLLMKREGKTTHY